MKTPEDLGEELCNHCERTDYGTEDINTNQYNMCEGGSCENAYENYKDNFEDEIMEHKRVIFNNPATIIIWEDNSKTIVKCNKDDKFKKKVGFLTAYFEKTSGMTKHQISKFFKGLKKQAIHE